MLEVLFSSAIIAVVPCNKRLLRQYLMVLFIILSQLHLKFKPTSLFEYKSWCSGVQNKKWQHHKFQVFSDTSIPIIRVTSALPVTVSIRSFSVLLATLWLCFSHSWLNKFSNTTVGKEGLHFLESAYLSLWTSKWSQSKNWCYQVITRQPSEFIRQNLTAVGTVQPFSVQGPLIPSCWNFSLHYKRG